MDVDRDDGGLAFLFCCAARRGRRMIALIGASGLALLAAFALLAVPE